MSKKADKIVRSDDKVIAGVCAGIAEYVGIDPLIIRIIFLIAFLQGGSGLFLYIILWVLIPDKKNSGRERKEVVEANSEEIKNEAKKFADKAKNVVDERSNKIGSCEE